MHTKKKKKKAYMQFFECVQHQQLSDRNPDLTCSRNRKSYACPIAHKSPVIIRTASAESLCSAPTHTQLRGNHRLGLELGLGLGLELGCTQLTCNSQAITGPHLRVIAVRGL
jgi:hypothetical protein